MQASNDSLLKQKQPKQQLQAHPEATTSVAEQVQPPVVEKVKKPRKPKTQAQLDAFKKVQEKRHESIEAKKYQKYLEAQQYAEKHNLQQKPYPPTKQKVVKPPPTPQNSVEEPETESEQEEIIEYRRKSKPKKKPKKTIVYYSDDSSEQEEEQQTQPKQQQPKQSEQRDMVSQQNKKSKFIVHNDVSTKNYFAD